MSISIEEVHKIARLARIELTPTEQSRHAVTISAVLDYMRVLDQVNTDGIEPTYQVTDLQNVIREDIARACPIRQELLAAMPALENDELQVPPVFE